jgi:hypothetical protein
MIGVSFSAAAMLALFVPAASSQDLLDALFGAFKRPAPPAVAPAATAYAPPALPPAAAVEKRAAETGGAWTAYCVRLCDGRFFPLQRSFAVSPAEQCRSLCPAAKTKVLGGGSIGSAAAADGVRYASLPNAFLYRKRLVENCTCNGRDAFGLARLDAASDLTLRAGDIVAVNGGFAAYAGAKSFTPIEKYSGLPQETRRKLTQTKVLPARDAATRAMAPAPTDKKPTWLENRSAQLFR